MHARVTDGTCLETLVRMAKPWCQAAEHQCPRTGPGRPPDFPDWLMAMLIMIAVLKKRKSKSAQYPVSVPVGTPSGTSAMAGLARVSCPEHVFRPVPACSPTVRSGHPASGSTGLEGRGCRCSDGGGGQEPVEGPWPGVACQRSAGRAGSSQAPRSGSRQHMGLQRTPWMGAGL